MSIKPGPQYPVKEGSKISGDPVVRVQDSGTSDGHATEAPVIQMDTSGLDNRQATGVKQLVLRQAKIRSDSESDLSDRTVVGTAVYTTDEEDISWVSSVPKDRTAKPTTGPKTKSDDAPLKPVLDKTREQKMKSGYKSSVKFLDKLSKRDPNSLSTRDRALMKKHAYNIRKYEKQHALNTTVVEREASKQASPKMTSEPATPLQKPERPSKSKVSVGTKPSKTETVLDLGPSTSKAAALARKKAVTSSKRQRSDDKQASENKRMKPSSSLNSPPELQVAIIDRGQPEGKITNDKWLLVEERIMRFILNEITQGSNKNRVLFDGVKWHKGVKVVGCSNKESLELLTACIRSLGGLWPGCELDVVPLKDVPFRTTVRVWIPPPLMEDETTLSLIKGQNEGVHPEDWTIVRGRARDKGNGKDLWLSISQRSEQILKDLHGKLRYGIGHLKIVLPVEKEKSSNETTAAEGGAN